MTKSSFLLGASQNWRLIRTLLKWLLQASLLISAIIIFVPLSPMMPGDSLDSSWVLGMNQAVAQGLTFGRDIIFTYGPYSSILTRSYHPSTDYFMLAGGLYLAVSYWIVLFLLTKERWWYLVLAFFVLSAVFTQAQDPVFFLYPLLVGAFCFKVITDKNQDPESDKLALFLIVILYFPFGLLPLIKGSLLIPCLLIPSLAFGVFLINKKWYLAVSAVVTPIISVLFFWIVADQAIVDFPHFFVSIIPIISGYTEAMAVNGEKWEVLFFLVAAFSILSSVALERRIPITSRIFLLSVFFVYLFMGFKAGFVRHDAHGINAGISILIAAMLYALVLRSRHTAIVLFVSIFSWMHIDSHYLKTSTENIVQAIQLRYSSAWKGFHKRFASKDWPKNDFTVALEALKSKGEIPPLQGTTDIYSYNQSYLISSDNIWNPRPVFQSYSAYTPLLAEKNKNHLLKDSSPDNVIFKVEPIDGRIPSIEDGASWPVLLSHYEPTALENDFLYLRKSSSRLDAAELVPLGIATKAVFGDVVAVPNAQTPIFVEISITPSYFGRLLNLFFKSTQLQISIILKNGERRTYRIISRMAKSGFMISPLIENTSEFGLLYGGGDYLSDKGVDSLSITQIGQGRGWKNSYDISFKRIDVSPAFNIAKRYSFNMILSDVSIYQVSTEKKCYGSIDSVKEVSGLLKVHGWLASSIDLGELTETALLVLTDSKGESIFISTKQASRPDVGAHFNRPILDESGYTSIADISTLEGGNYVLGLALKTADSIKICSQIKFPITLK